MRPRMFLSRTRLPNLEIRSWERKLLKAYKQNKTGEGRSDEFKQELCGQIIDRAKAYFGVPIKEDQEPDAPEAPSYCLA